MTSEKEKIIDYFRRRFLRLERKPRSFSEILGMEPTVLKDCKPKDAELLKKIGIKKIRDLTKIKKEHIESTAEKAGIDVNRLRKWVLAANLISRAWQKRSRYLKKKEMKVAVLGLDNAGKTSILNVLTEKGKLGIIEDTQPTTGVDIRRLELENYRMIIWDFGGQQGHRHDYMLNPEDYFVGIDLIFFVIDMQDSDRYDESIEYFGQILDIIKFMGEHPYILILLHKSDPDIIDTESYQLNFEYVNGAFEEKLSDTGLTYEIVKSSIFNLYSTEPEFAGMIKNLFGKSSSAGNLEEMVENLEKKLVELGATIVANLQIIKEKIENITSGNIYRKNLSGGKSAPSLLRPPPDVTPASPPTPGAAKERPVSGGPSIRAAMMNELKNVLKMRRIV